MTTTAQRAAIYTRISNDPTGRALGVADQEAGCRQLAERLGLEVVRVFVDNDISASVLSKKERPEYDELLRWGGASRYDVIICYSSERFTRRMTELVPFLEWARAQRLRFVTTEGDDTDTANGQMILHIKGAVAQQEAQRISERVQRRAQQRARLGEWHGGPLPPLGLRFVRENGDGKVATLEEHPDTAPLLVEGAARVLTGESLYAICADWNGRALRTQADKQWRSQALKRSLLAPAAIGKTRTEDGELHDTTWPALLDRETWDRLHELLEAPDRKFGPVDGSYRSKRALGGGLSVCGSCGKKLVSQKYGDVIRLVCHRQSTGGCGHLTIDYAQLETFVLDMVWAALDTPRFRRALVARRQRAGVDSAEVDDLRTQLDRIPRQLDQAYEDRNEGIVAKDVYLRRRATLEGDQERLVARLHELSRPSLLDQVPDLQAARERYDRGDVVWRRQFLSEVLHRVVVLPHPKGVATHVSQRRDEADEAYAERRAGHRRELLRRRVQLEWRA